MFYTQGVVGSSCKICKDQVFLFPSTASNEKPDRRIWYSTHSELLQSCVRNYGTKG